MANDHFISRFLTKPWEVGSRRLCFYDFKADRFGERSSETLFAADGLHSKETGDRLNRLIETPVSQHRAAVLAGDGRFVGPDNDWKLFRALVGLIRLQPQRHLDKENPGQQKFSLDDLIAQGESFLDYIASETVKTHVLIGVALREGAYQMSFTEAVYFPIPIVGTEPILAVPLTPGHFIALPRKGYETGGLEQWLALESAMSGFSIGLGGSANKVILPPQMRPTVKNDPIGLRTMLRELRSSCRDMFNSVGKANALVGFSSFTYTGGDDEPGGREPP